MTRNDPVRNFRYRLEIDSITQAGFSEVAIADTTIEAVDYREGIDPMLRKVPGLRKHPIITLKKGLTNSVDLFEWYQENLGGLVKEKRRKVVIVAQDEAGVEVRRFVIPEAWPVKYITSDLNAKGNEVVIETIELANEGIERV
jgi:phage tail-like protein